MKISIIGGAGRIGSSIAYATLLRNIDVDELVLYDIVDSVHGEAMDLDQATIALKKNTKVWATKDLQDCRNSDIIVIAAGVSLSTTKTINRYDTLAPNIKILDAVFDGLQQNENTIYIIVTNPIDVMTYILNQKVKDRKRVIGISTITDTARMNTFTKGYMIGEHAGFMVSINGDADSEKVIALGSEVIESKKGTWFLTPIGVTDIIDAVCCDKKIQFPVSTLLKGEYGLSDVCLSVPCIIGRKGIEGIKELKLTIDQKYILSKARDSVRKGISSARI